MKERGDYLIPQLMLQQPILGSQVPIPRYLLSRLGIPALSLNVPRYDARSLLRAPSTYQAFGHRPLGA